MPCPISPAPSTPTFEISISLRSSGSYSSAGSLHGTCGNRGSRTGAPRRDAAGREAERDEPRTGRGALGGLPRGRRGRRGAGRRGARRRPDVLVGDGPRGAALPVRPPRDAAFVQERDPRDLEAAGRDAEGDDLPDP